MWAISIMKQITVKLCSSNNGLKSIKPHDDGDLLTFLGI